MAYRIEKMLSLLEEEKKMLKELTSRKISELDKRYSDIDLIFNKRQRYLQDLEKVIKGKIRSSMNIESISMFNSEIRGRIDKYRSDIGRLKEECLCLQEALEGIKKKYKNATEKVNGLRKYQKKLSVAEGRLKEKKSAVETEDFILAKRRRN
ncbi:MAG TPA: hypothetical protein VII00_09000 [bacterium]